MPQDDPDHTPAVLFRQSKKRKLFRQRLPSTSTNPPPAASPSSPAATITTTTTTASASASAPAPASATTSDDASASASLQIATLAINTLAPIIPRQSGSTTLLRADEQRDDDYDDLDDDNDGDDQQPESVSVSVSELIRARNARKARLRGIAFTIDQGLARSVAAVGVEEAASATEGSGGDMVPYPGGASDTTPALAVANRFTSATGVIGELNTRHMMEYVESGLAKRLQPQPQQATPATTAAKTPTHTVSCQPPPRGPSAPPHKVSDSQPAALRGRILEVDLGEEARSRNVTLTERAARRLKGDKEGDADEASGAEAGSRPRRNRRTSNDIKRDKLVEEFLHQNRLDVYDTDPVGGEIQSSGGNYFDHDLHAHGNEDQDLDGIAADDRIAEKFRREFMDALHERQQLRRRKRKAAANAPPRTGPGSSSGPGRPGKKDDGDVLRGPKLGGSRNDRAQMRDLLLAGQKVKKASVSGQGRRH